MDRPMSPPIENSIVRIRDGLWLFGSQYTCEIGDTVPDHAVKSWEFDGAIYYIRKSSADEQESFELGDSVCTPTHHSSTSTAVWNIGGTFVKVKAWMQGMQLESDTIQFVNTISSVPTPEVIISWVDVSRSRSFLVTKALSGQTLDERWSSLSADQHERIAHTVARYCGILALQTSQKLETANGCGITDPALTVPPPDMEPSGRPQAVGPYSSDQLRSYLSAARLSASWTRLEAISNTEKNHTKLFYFSHAHLGPSNIIVADDGSVVAIIDWELAAFYPSFWLATKPIVTRDFLLQIANRRAWAYILSETLEDEGFLFDIQMYHEWEAAFRW